MRFIRKVFLFLLVLICIGLGAWVFQDNPEPINMVFLGFQTVTLPKGIWLLAALLLGCLLGIVSSYPLVFRLRAKIRQLQKQAKTPVEKR